MKDLKRFLKTRWDKFIYDGTNIGSYRGNGILKTYTENLDDLLVVSLMIGFLVVMTGHKKEGTKITSLSILIYLITKVVLIAYVY